MRSAVILAAVLAASACGAQIGDPATLVDARGTPDRQGSGSSMQPDPDPDPGSGSGSGSADPAPAITGTQFVNGFYTSYCTEVFACKSSFPNNLGYTFEQGYGDSAADCTASYEDFYGTSHVDGDVANGKIQFDPAAAQACLDGIVDPTCTAFWQNGLTLPAECDTAIAGTVANGGECNSAFECSDGKAICSNRVCVLPNQ